MKKTFFQTTFNLNVNLIVLALLSLFFKIGINLLIQTLETNKLSGMQGLFTTILDKLTSLEHYLQLLSLCFIIPILLIIIELVQRLSKDSLWNYFKSIYQTSRMRQFLKQDEKSEPMNTIENQTVTRINPILKSFNHSVLGCTVDVRKETVTVLLAIPRTQQAQKLLKEMEDDIKEEISSRNPSYYFSSPHRKGNKLWFTGTKR
ncbi:hypothetical protein [Streptococcus vestibularis]|jgi:hypothetical protein|uniref:hypothetical protein n=1 Tax=Streptococcus vestibularis TaxID=1343 RepID=UPI001D0BB027|nr:hypothetical protein [Streptococcus vestibularis]MCB8556736.1 hypothetical protein [Streptococcus vestibularis]MCB8587526.1 hypothetical protein [Streptococcus vestibularis]MCY7009710.1 hypothetical protein [Streptococcus vestibularis]